MRKRLLVLLLLSLSCTEFDETPDFLLSSLRPELFLSVELSFTSLAANVWFAAKKPPGPSQSPRPWVLAWARQGGNIYDDTLGSVQLEARETQNLWRWSGPVTPPWYAGSGSGFDHVGVELIPSLAMVAFSAPPLAGSYCEVDVMGAGIGNCGEWVMALLNLWVQCYGEFQRVVECSGSGYAMLPSVTVQAFAERKSSVDSAPIQFLQFGSLLVIFEREDRSWWYAPLPRKDGSNDRGPFQSSEAAADAAAAALDLPPSMMAASGASVLDPDSVAGRTEAALFASMRRQLAR